MRSTNRWKQKSIEVRDKAQWMCEVCRDEGRITYEMLEVHHIEKVKDNSELLLDNSNLICLCVTHHKKADSGILKKDYLKKLAEAREQR